MACGCKKKLVNKKVELLSDAGASKEALIAEATSTDEFFPVVYNGPTYPHNMRSTSGIISDYGISHYGVGKRGSIINVHRIDYEHPKGKGKLYLPITVEEGDDMKDKGVRTTGFLDKRNYSNEQESNRLHREEIEKTEKAEKKAAKKTEVKEENNSADLVEIKADEGKSVTEQEIAKTDVDNTSKVFEAPKKAASKPEPKLKDN